MKTQLKSFFHLYVIGPYSLRFKYESVPWLTRSKLEDDIGCRQVHIMEIILMAELKK